MSGRCITGFLNRGYFLSPTTVEKQLTESEIFQKNKGLIFHVLRKYRTRNDFEDLFQEMSAALLKAVRMYNLERGTQFSTFAVKVMERRLSHVLIGNTRLKRGGKSSKTVSLDSPIPGAEDLTLVDILRAKQPTAEETTAANETWEKVFSSDRLSAREKAILRLHCNGYGFQEIAEFGGVSRQCIHKIYSKAIRRARRIVNSPQSQA